MKRSRLKALLFHLAFWALLVLCIVGSERSGGTVLPLDFLGGYSVYVKSDGSGTSDTQSTMWMVSDDDVKKDIFRLCKKVEQYRKFIRVSDLMLGVSNDMGNFPIVYLLTDAVIYRIEIMDWENYASDYWNRLPIWQEKFGEPVLHLYRIDRSSIPEGESLFDWSTFWWGSLEDDGSAGGYSTLTREELDALLALLQSVGPDNAVLVEQFE